MNNFGENLKRARIAKNVSQGKLAELMSIHATHISRYERNLTVPSIDVVKKMAEILEVTTDDLVYGSQAEKASSKISDLEFFKYFHKSSKS